MNRISVLLIEDHELVREGFRALLALEPGIEVIGEAANGRSGIAMYRELKPDVVLMDIAMPDLNGIEAARQILRDWPEAKILILTAHGDAAYRERAQACGAVGLLLKQTTATKLYKAIRQAHGQSYEPTPDSAKSRQDKRKAQSPGGLTSREVEVLQLIAEGQANKQAARTLGISTKTIEKHREHVMQKLGIHDTAGLTRYAIEAGVIESSIQSTTEP